MLLNPTDFGSGPLHRHVPPPVRGGPERKGPILQRTSQARRPAMSQIGSRGESSSTKAGRASTIKLFETFLRFRASKAEYPALPTSWLGLREEDVTKKWLYQRFAGYLAKDTVIPPGRKHAGKPYRAKTIVKALGVVLNEAKARFYDDTDRRETTKFFNCLVAPSSVEWAWLQGLKSNCKRYVFSRSSKNDEKMDYSAPPIDIEHIKAAVRNYSLEGSVCSVERAFTLVVTWQVCAAPHHTLPCARASFTHAPAFIRTPARNASARQRFSLFCDVRRTADGRAGC